MFSMLPKKAVDEFKRIYRKRFGVELNDVEASRRANNFVNLYKAVYGKSTFGKIQNKEVENRELSSKR